MTTQRAGCPNCGTELDPDRPCICNPWHEHVDYRSGTVRFGGYFIQRAMLEDTTFMASEHPEESIVWQLQRALSKFGPIPWPSSVPSD